MRLSRLFFMNAMSTIGLAFSGIYAQAFNPVLSSSEKDFICGSHGQYVIPISENFVETFLFQAVGQVESYGHSCYQRAYVCKNGQGQTGLNPITRSQDLRACSYAYGVYVSGVQPTRWIRNSVVENSGLSNLQVAGGNWEDLSLINSYIQRGQFGPGRVGLHLTARSYISGLDFDRTNLKVSIGSLAVSRRGEELDIVELLSDSRDAGSMRDITATGAVIRFDLKSGASLENLSLQNIQAFSSLNEGSEIRMQGVLSARMIDLSGELPLFSAKYSQIQQMNMRNLRVSSFHLIDSKLISSDLSGTELPNAQFKRTFATSATLDSRRASISRVSFNNALLRGAVFEGLEGNQLYISTAGFDQARLRDAQFIHVRIEDTSFREANLTRSQFTDVQLTRSSLSQANLNNASLQNVYFWGGSMESVQATNLQVLNSTLNGAQLMGAQLEGSRFVDSTLENANFETANLENAQFGSPESCQSYGDCRDYDGANFRGANLSGAQLYGDFKYTQNLREANLEGAVYFDRATRLPFSDRTARDLGMIKQPRPR